MEQSLSRSFAKFIATAFWACVLALGFISLLILFGDHHRGHVPTGVVTLSFAVLIGIFLTVRAVDIYASRASPRTVFGKAVLDGIITYSAALVVFGGWTTLGALLGNVARSEVEIALLYTLTGVCGCLFWFFGRRK